jgi:hypothetical protein
MIPWEYFINSTDSMSIKCWFDTTFFKSFHPGIKFKLILPGIKLGSILPRPENFPGVAIWSQV